MTKNIRIENADTSSYKVRVTVEELTDEGWKVTGSKELAFPTAMDNWGIHKTKRLIVEEVVE